MTTRGIRSGAHRRILSFLRSGPATVSELAKQFDMRMSHTSLACRQLRAAELIVRDESGGLRNAPISLSQKGVERLRENAVAKLRQYADQFSTKSSACVLQVDGPNVLIGYADLPPGPLIFIPDASKASSGRSTGNKGGVWVLFAEESVAWFTFGEFLPTTPPTAGQGVTLDDFSNAPQKVGLVRGSIFESVGDSQLSEGKRFVVEEAASTPPPARLRVGPVSLGTVVGTKHSFFPPQGLLARLPSSIDRSQVLDALSQDALLLSDKNALRRRHLPLSVLRPWLELRHPRMSDERRESMWEELTGVLAESDASLSVSLRRELLIDFGEVQWSREDWTPSELDIYGMSLRGVTCVLTSVLDDVRVPFCIDWPFEDAPENLYQRALVHPSCRVWIWRRGTLPAQRPEALLVKPTSLVSVVNVHSGRRDPLPILLGRDEPTGHNQGVSLLSPPKNAADLLERQRLYDGLNTGHQLPEGKHGVRLRKALDVYPSGDESLANRFEGKDALAAWIASPPDQRPGRWIRLHDRLPAAWVNLLPVEEVPTSHLVHAIKNGDAAFRSRAVQRFGLELGARPDLLISVVEGLRDEVFGSWFAACLLTSLRMDRPGNRDVLLQAIDTWSRNPVCAAEVLENQFHMTLHFGSEGHPLLEPFIRLGLNQPAGSLFSVWASSMEALLDGRPWLPEHQRRIMETLPLAWWAGYAGDWLTAQLASVSGRTWLRDHEVPWTAQLFHPPGWLGGLPGVPIPHPACTLSSDQLIGIKLLGKGIGVAALNDLYESMYAFEQGLPPPPCSTHPLAGWLVRPVETWPMMNETVLTMGEVTTGRVLFSNAYHHRVRSPNPLS